MDDLIRQEIEVRAGRVLSVQTGGAESNSMLFFIHGAGGRGDQWEAQVKEFKDRHFIVVPDLLGHGKSPVPRDGYRFEELAADLKALSQYFRKKRNIVIGHSYGTAFALWLAAQKAEAVERVVLIGAANFRESKAGIWNLPVPILNLLQPRFSKGFARGAFHPDTNPEFVQREQEISDRNPMAMMQALFKGMQFPEGYNLTKVSCPVLIINGVADKLTPVESAKELCNQLPDCRMEVVEKASHLVMMEQSKEVSRLVGEFIDNAARK